MSGAAREPQSRGGCLPPTQNPSHLRVYGDENFPVAAFVVACFIPLRIQA
jgi:hypothetical protein